MKRILLITTILILTLGLNIKPSIALSPIADDFIRACYTLDAPFPPPSWDKVDIQYAAYEVLNEIESGNIDSQFTSFVLKALGSVADPSDLPLILSYYDDMNHTVLNAIAGFPHADAVNFLMAKTDDENTPIREIAVLGLSKIDFTKMDKPLEWYNTVRDKLTEVRDKEKVDWLKSDITRIINNLNVPEQTTQ